MGWHWDLSPTSLCFVLAETPSTKLTEISGKPLKDANELRRKPCSWRSRPWWLPLCFGNCSLDFQNCSAAGTNPLPGLFYSAWLGMSVISRGRVSGWGDAALPQWELWAMCMGQSHMFPKLLESWMQMQWKTVSLCVLFYCPGFLDSHSHTGKFIILLKKLSHSYLISVDQSVSYRLLLEQRQPRRKPWQWTQQSRQLFHPFC